MSLPVTTGIENSNSLIGNHRRITQTTTTTVDRCFFLLIHFFFYILILIIICTRLGQFNTKHEKILAMLNSNPNLTIPSDSSDPNSFDCSCQTIPYPRRNRTTRCLELHVGLTETISNAFCPISHDDHEHNQWLVIQNRQSNNINFNRTWTEYRRGFGDVNNQIDFWLGNENLYWLTNHYPCRLKIELTDWHNETRIGTYELFRISNQNDDYRIQIGGYNGNIEVPKKIDSFSHWHHNAPFSTYDHDTTDGINCPQLYGGHGWWYHSAADCAHVQLNGVLATHSDGLVPFNTGILWIGWKIDRHYSFQRVRMSIQPKLKRDRFHH